VASINIGTQQGAQAALAVADAALQYVDATRGQLGAVQNRLLSTIANLANVAENVTAARSRIQDADFAAETANLTRASILQQAGISVLAQANALPQQTLALLQ
jgi:flagellin